MSFAPKNIEYNVKNRYRKVFFVAIDDYILTNQSIVSLAENVFIFKTCLEIMKVKLI